MNLGVRNAQLCILGAVSANPFHCTKYFVPAALLTHEATTQYTDGHFLLL